MNDTVNEAPQQTQQVEPDVTSPIPTVNPLMSTVRLPGVRVRLPSRGTFYDQGELDPNVKDGEVHVYPMTAIDEIILKSPDKLLSGDSIREVFNRCIPEVKNVDRLFAKDVDFLVLALRKASYGSEYEVNYVHSCPDAKSHSYTCDVQEFMTNSVELDPVKMVKLFVYRTAAGQKIQFIPLSFKGLMSMLENNQNAETPESIQLELFNSIISTIDNVDGCSERDFIIEWLASLEVKEVRGILAHIELLGAWGPSYEFKDTCKDCKQEIEIAAPINPLSFFS